MTVPADSDFEGFFTRLDAELKASDDVDTVDATAAPDARSDARSSSSDVPYGRQQPQQPQQQLPQQHQQQHQQAPQQAPPLCDYAWAAARLEAEGRGRVSLIHARPCSCGRIHDPIDGTCV